MEGRDIDTDAAKDLPTDDQGAAISQEDAVVFSILLPPDSQHSIFDRVSGMLAYSQYALQKHQYIEKYTRDNGKLPTEEQIKTLIISFKDKNSDALENLKHRAEKFLKEYAEEYSDRIRKENILDPVEKIVKKHTGFWFSVGASLVGGLLYSFAIAIAIFIATAAIPDAKFSKIIKLLMNEPVEIPSED